MKTKSINLFCVIFFIYTLGLHAQGPELIVNGDFSSNNSGFTSDYTYCNSANCLFPEGFYAVGTNPNFFHPDFFGTDHTTGTGNLMIINGKVEPTKSVWCETISVNSGTEYKFSCWISSMVVANPAILQLKINGVDIGSKCKAPTSLYNWKQFSVVWNSGANTSADICLVDLNTIGYGNDFGLDDISFRSSDTKVNEQDSLALVDLYNSTDGSNWINHENWLTEKPLSTWYGVTVSGTNVTTIELNNNKLNGHIPATLGKLKFLQDLYVDGNQLTGHIPPSLGRLKNLVVFSAKNNDLKGQIPSSLGALSNLRHLVLSHNRLSGNIPSSFTQLKNLRTLRLRDNLLSGTVPSFLGTLPKLNRLNILHNYYNFDGLETLVQSNDLDTLKYERQRKIYVHQKNNTLSVYAGGTLSNNTYKWFNSGVLAASITGDSTFAPIAGGDYSVEVTNSIVAALTLRSDTVSFTGLKGAQQNAIAARSNYRNNYTVYPNPVRDILHLDNLKGKATISIITQDGRVVDKKIVSNSPHEWNVQHLAAGTYYMRIEEGTKTTLLKFIKQ